MVKFPCKTCDKRTPGCHSTCDAYKEAHKQQVAINEAREKARLLNVRVK